MTQCIRVLEDNHYQKGKFNKPPIMAGSKVSITTDCDAVNSISVGSSGGGVVHAIFASGGSIYCSLLSITSTLDRLELTRFTASDRLLVPWT